MCISPLVEGLYLPEPKRALKSTHLPPFVILNFVSTCLKYSGQVFGQTYLDIVVKLFYLKGVVVVFVHASGGGEESERKRENLK